MRSNLFRLAVTGLLAGALGFTGATAAETLRISSGVGQQHFWAGEHMDPFMEAIESADIGINFEAYYSGSLVTPGQELDGLKDGIIHVAAPLLAPYHEGRFPLSDITQLPTLETNSELITDALLELMDSDKALKDGKSFYDYELGDKGIRGWPVGATSAYSLATTGIELKEPSDIEGLPIRAGSPLHTILLEELGATPVTMTSADSYEALSRDTVEGTILSVADWPSYSFEDLLKYTITGISMGHWESYLAMTEETWQGLTDEQRETWDRIAREIAMKNARYIDQRETKVREETSADGATFVEIDDLSEDMQAHMSTAASQTWIRWIEQLEEDGHPALAAARQWAELVMERGGKIPEGAKEYLELD
ncbi:TRAP transporter substrate-binding protein DctP [Alcanivorax sp. ZXX171]|nr:TRAP transporter substrate-binding protein DctP [Alcanivorax sp. ZXX171]